MKTNKTDSAAQQEYMLAHLRHHRFVRWARLLLLVFFLALWEFCADKGLIDSFFFSSPSRVAACFVSMLQNKSLFLHIGVTLTETVVSFLLIVLISLAAATLLWHSKRLSEIAEPYLVVLNSLPKSAMAPIFIVWLGNNMKTIIVTAISVAIFGSILNLFTSFMSTDPDKLKLIKTLGGTKKDALFKVILPGSVPLILSILKVDIGLCLIGVVIGEFLAAKEGLGYLIIYGSQVFKMDWVMLSIVLLCLIAALLYGVLNRLEKHFRNF